MIFLMLDQTDEYFMKQALAEAEKALEKDEVPVGAVIVRQGSIIARAHNLRETLKDPTAHAEIIAITQAAAYLESWRLTGCTLYCTVEPCPMCAGAIVLARIDAIVFAVTDEKTGSCGTLYDIPRDSRLNHRAKVKGGVLEKECRQIIQKFFAEKRTQEKQSKS